MKLLKRSALFLTVAASITTRAIPASADCVNKYRPTVYSETIPNVDGSKWVKVMMLDQDYKGRGALYLYQNGRPLQSDLLGGYIKRLMPKGAGTWSFYMGNLNACGVEVETLSAVTIEGN